LQLLFCRLTVADNKFTLTPFIGIIASMALIPVEEAVLPAAENAPGAFARED
jgi:hypothetical protein